jgi:hypothetical protein
MDFSFGIITSVHTQQYLENTIQSIIDQNIENYEILVIGGKNTFLNSFHEDKHFIRHFKFDEDIKKKWITRKKNIIIEKSNFENIVFLHDYLVLDRDWYRGYLNFGNNFVVSTNRILNLDNTRFRDWTLSPGNYLRIDEKLTINMEYLLPYCENKLTKYMYISGAYWVAKKKFMERNKLNEKLLWGQGEDVEWSHRVRRKTKFKFNEESTVYLQKQKEIYFTEITQKNLNIIKNRSFINKKIDRFLIPFRRYRKKKKFFSRI